MGRCVMNAPVKELTVVSATCSDLLHRLEYLALTGSSPTWQLEQVFKPSNNLFAKKHPGFRPWLNMRAARRLHLYNRAQQALQPRSKSADGETEGL